MCKSNDGGVRTSLPPDDTHTRLDMRLIAGATEKDTTSPPVDDRKGASGTNWSMEPCRSRKKPTTNENKTGGMGETTNNAIGLEENSPSDKEASYEPYPDHELPPKGPPDIWGEKLEVEKGGEDSYPREDRLANFDTNTSYGGERPEQTIGTSQPKNTAREERLSVTQRRGGWRYFREHHYRLSSFFP